MPDRSEYIVDQDVPKSPRSPQRIVKGSGDHPPLPERPKQILVSFRLIVEARDQYMIRNLKNSR